MNNNTQESKVQLEYINKCTEIVKEKYEKEPAFFIQNAGCQMNSLQTETVAGIVKRMGYKEVFKEEDADVVIYNTCTVRENANLKIYGHLGHLKSIKKKKPEMKIVLFGCMMQEPEVIEKIHKDYSFVDLVFGTHNFHKFPELFYRSLNTERQIIDVWKESDEIVEGMPADRKYSFKTGVNIMFGCNNFCSYCIVPYVRGREKSREPEAIVEEIKALVADGVTEVMLLGQNVNSYGKTLEHPVTFAQLLKQVEAIEGLKRIRHTKNIGLQALMQACNVQPENISAYHFGYVLGPCVNATGRLDTARHALRLFETGQETEAEEIARDLVDLNQERKELTLQGVEMAKKLCEEGGYENDPVLVLFLPDVHESIAGLIAGRIREMYNRPVFVLTRGEEGVKGSGRSTENYSMYENMCGCVELFTKFGGHPMAAGLSLPEENVEKFRRKINENCPLTVEEVCPDIHIDMAMPVGYASTELVHQFALLEPFGKDNPSPLFADRNLSISRMWLIGKNRNVLRMSVLSEYGQPVPVIFFGDVETLFAYFTEKFGQEEVENALHGRKNRILFSMVYTAKIDFYQGNENLQLEMKYYR